MNPKTIAAIGELKNLILQQQSPILSELTTIVIGLGAFAILSYFMVNLLIRMKRMSLKEGSPVEAITHEIIAKQIKDFSKDVDKKFEAVHKDIGGLNQRFLDIQAAIIKGQSGKLGG